MEACDLGLPYVSAFPEGEAAKGFERILSPVLAMQESDADAAASLDSGETKKTKEGLIENSHPCGREDN